MLGRVGRLRARGATSGRNLQLARRCLRGAWRHCHYYDRARRSRRTRRTRPPLNRRCHCCFKRPCKQKQWRLRLLWGSVLRRLQPGGPAPSPPPPNGCPILFCCWKWRTTLGGIAFACSHGGDSPARRVERIPEGGRGVGAAPGRYPRGVTRVSRRGVAGRVRGGRREHRPD